MNFPRLLAAALCAGLLASTPARADDIKVLTTGILDAVAPKLLRLAPGLSVGEALAEGRGQLGFTQVSELLAVPGIERLGPLGPEVQRLTIFTFGVRPGVGTPPAAKTLVEFLTSSAVDSQAQHAGLEPR
jgi:molybdate transport system substrate-binding protein